MVLTTIRTEQASMVALSWVHRLTRPLTGVVLALGLIMGGLADLSVHGLDLAATPERPSADAGEMPLPESEAQPQPSSSFPASGVYLYGRSPEPDQIGSEYAVLEVVGDRTIGAFYMPHSSFDCFYGEIQADRLTLTVVNSYEQAAYDYSVALQRDGVIASFQDASSAPTKLVGYHRIMDLSDRDRHILNTCRTAHEEQI